MVLCELSDMIGAIEGYIKRYNITLDQLIEMKNLTKTADLSEYTDEQITE